MSLSERSDHIEELVRPTGESTEPKLPQRTVTLFACPCGALSLGPIEAHHWIGYPNAFGKPRCPFDEGGKPVLYSCDSQYGG